MIYSISKAELTLMSEFLKGRIQSEENSDIKAGYVRGIDELSGLIEVRIDEKIEYYLREFDK